MVPKSGREALDRTLLVREKASALADKFHIGGSAIKKTMSVLRPDIVFYALPIPRIHKPEPHKA